MLDPMAAEGQLNSGGIKGRLRHPAARVSDRRLRWSDQRIGLSVVYHGVGAEAEEDPLGLSLDRGFFQEQVRYLKAHYSLVPASRLFDAARERDRGEPFPVAITFDDDRSTHLHEAKPILEAADAPATFFLCGATLDRPFAFWWEHFERAIGAGAIEETELRALVPPAIDGVESVGPRDLKRIAADIEFMDPPDRDALSELLRRRTDGDPPANGLGRADVRRLVEGDLEVGFHTRTHQNLTILDDERLASELSSGREAVADAAEQEITTIAYPGGRWNRRVLEAAEAAGYDWGFTCDPVPVAPHTNPFAIGRLDPGWCTTMGHFAVAVARALRGGYPPWPPPPERATHSEQATPSRSSSDS